MSRMVCRGLVFAVSLSAVLLAEAKPAPWFLWASRYDGHTACAQFMPAQGWLRLQGAFRDAACRWPGRP